MRIDEGFGLDYLEIVGFGREISRKIAQREYEYSKHAVDQMIVRNVTVWEFEQAFSRECEVVEDYPFDKYGPSCLLLGFTFATRPLHAQTSYPGREFVKVVTVYEPSTVLWIDFRRRSLPFGGHSARENH